MNPVEVRTGSAEFIEELKNKCFRSEEEVLMYLKGEELTFEYLENNQFSQPIVVKNPTGLGIKIPSFTDYDDLKNYIDPDYKVEIIDVRKQQVQYWKFSNFIAYMKTNYLDRSLILNMISLECTDLPLGDLIQPPKVALEIDWAKKFWEEPKPGCTPELPQSVQKYCLMGSKDSYTDFHIDFSGTSVWYHIAKGMKIFYLIEPSNENLGMFWQWNSSKKRMTTFLGDFMNCYKCVLKENMTLLLPGGWIHAVLTAEDSLVFGGNYLQSFNIPRQLEIYGMEVKQRIILKQRYPCFQDMNFFAARGICNEVKSFLQNGDPPPLYLVNGIKSFQYTLKLWLKGTSGAKFRVHDPQNLLKDLASVRRKSEKILQRLKKPERESCRLRKKPSRMEDYITEF